MKNVKLIQTLSAGVEKVPYDELNPAITIVCSNSGGNAYPTAEHAFALIMSAIKRIPYHDRIMRKGIWNRQIYGYTLRGKTIGIIGYGKIGREIAKIAKLFNMRVLAIKRKRIIDELADFIGTPEDLDFVLKESDIVVLSLPLTKETRGLITREKLKIMKKNAILVNISRGPVIVEKDLYEHLKENPEFIAALDVWWNYPKGEKCFQNYPFHELDNVIMTPHIAGFARDYLENWYRYAIENIKRFLEGKMPRNIVDLREYI